MKKTLIMLFLLSFILFSGCVSSAELKCCQKSKCNCSEGTCCSKGECVCKDSCCQGGKCLRGDGAACTKCSCPKK